MGAWETDIFSNDDAMDFLGDLSELSSNEASAKLREALQEAAEASDYLELPTASNAIAAAAIMAIRIAPGLMPANNPTATAVVELAAAPDDVTKQLALTAYARVFNSADNEWYELWEESGELETLTASLASFKAALEGPSQAGSEPSSTTPIKSMLRFLKKKQ